MQTKLDRESTAKEGVIDATLLRIDTTKKLGQGGFGVVYKGKYRGKEVAAKQILNELTPEVQKEFEAEARIMSQLHDPSIIHLYGVTKDVPRYMVLEYCTLGSLDRYLQGQKVEEVSWEVRFHLATGIASGLQYLHTYNPIIVHGDLKSLNVLLTGNPLRPDTKIADFGMAKLKTESQRKTLDFGGKGFSVQWTAPELFSKKNKKNTASDLYAFGMTLWEIASHKYPWADQDPTGICTAVAIGEREDIPENTHPLFKKVMTDCCAQKAEERPSAKVVLDELQTYDSSVELEITENTIADNSIMVSGGLVESTSSSGSSGSSMTSGTLKASSQGVVSQGAFTSRGGDTMASSTKTGINSSPYNSGASRFGSEDRVSMSNSVSSSPSSSSAMNVNSSPYYSGASGFARKGGEASSSLFFESSASVSPVVSKGVFSSQSDDEVVVNSSASGFHEVVSLKGSVVSLTYTEQVAAISQSVRDKINPEELKALLKWVTEGHLEEVEKLLKKSPSLALATGAVTDRSDRAFNNITALQYAAWALDTEMTELIMKYIAAHDGAIQLSALEEEPQHYSTYGASYDFMALVKKCRIYLENYSKWDDEKCYQYWQKEIGGEQRKSPAWLIYAWGEQGSDVAWTKQDPDRKIMREHNFHRLDWWFTENYKTGKNNGRGVGTTWFTYRGVLHVWGMCTIPKFLPGLSQTTHLTISHNINTAIGHDIQCVSVLGASRRRTLQRLMSQVNHSFSDGLPTSTATLAPTTTGVLELSTSMLSSPLQSRSFTNPASPPIVSSAVSMPKGKAAILNGVEEVEVTSKSIQDKIHNVQTSAPFAQEVINKNKTIFEAAETNDIPTLKSFLEQGTEVDVARKGETPLWRAAAAGQLGALEWLIDKGANVNQRNHNNGTPLLRASTNGHLACVKCLVENGANINATNNGGVTPIQNAFENGHLEVVRYLISKGAKPTREITGSVGSQTTTVELSTLAVPQTSSFLPVSSSSGIATTVTPMPSLTASASSAGLVSTSNVNPLLTSSSFSTVFHPVPSSASLKSNLPLSTLQQVKATAKAVQSKIRPRELTELLKWVTEGHLEKVEEGLKKNPSLSLGIGTVTDLSDRTFKNITVLQYAAWALDAEMVELIMKYVEAKHSVVQLKALAGEHQTYSPHGASYDELPLVNKYKSYLNNYSQWDDNKCMQYWQKEIGGEQRKCPAWLVYAWSEEGTEVAWTKQDPTRKIKREYDRLKYWFTESVIGGRAVGSACAAIRGGGSCVGKGRGIEIYNYGGTTTVNLYRGSQTFVMEFDQKCISDLVTSRCGILQKLKASIENQLTQATSLDSFTTLTQNTTEHRVPAPY